MIRTVIISQTPSGSWVQWDSPNGEPIPRPLSVFDDLDDIDDDELAELIRDRYPDWG